jgi:D-threo-aldose 1-dehydrogenase
MEAITIPNTDFSVSRFIFGTGSLFNAGPLLKRLAVLEAAVEHGFTHFDAAPYYGFGMAERDLAHVLRKHHALTVTTKVGIYPPGGEQRSALSVLFRKTGGKVFPALSRPTVDFSLQRAQWSLEGSLRRLGRDCIDVYMLSRTVVRTRQHR